MKGSQNENKNETNQEPGNFIKIYILGKRSMKYEENNNKIDKIR